jgi:hypothetical protein
MGTCVRVCSKILATPLGTIRLSGAFVSWFDPTKCDAEA